MPEIIYSLETLRSVIHLHSPPLPHPPVANPDDEQE